MKNLLFVLIAIAGGMLGAYISANYSTLSFGATQARTTVTNPWTFTATTTTKNIDTGTTNAATSTVIAGCFQFYATSTVTAHRFLASTTPGIMYSAYGKCPRI